MDKETTWILKLRENVLGPLKKLTEIAGGAQKKITDIATATSRFAREHTTAGQVSARSLNGLNEQLRRLQDLQSRAWDTKHIQSYERAINRVKSNIDDWKAKTKLPELNVKTGWMDRMKGQFNDVLSQIPGGSALLTAAKSPAFIYGAAAAAAISFGHAAVDSSAQFDYGMKKINATAQMPLATLAKLEGRLVEIGKDSGGNFSRVPDSYEKILSVSGRVNESLNILQVAVKGAKAGFADLDLVGKSLAYTLAVVGSKNATAGEVMDVLLRAKAVGAGEFADFANYLPQLIAAGRNVGIMYKDVAGLFAFMTYKGNDAANSTMFMLNAIQALQKKDVLVGLKQKGFDLFDAKGARKNIQTILLDLSKHLSKFSDEQRTKFFLDIGLNDQQARTAFSVLLSDADNLKRIMNDVNNATGETNKQLALTQNYITSWGSIGDEWKAIGKAVGDALLPIVDVLTQGLAGFGRGLKDIFTGRFLTKSFWTDEEGGMQSDVMKGARDNALAKTRSHFNLSAGQSFNREQNEWFKKFYDQYTSSVGNLYSKNRLDPNEKDNVPTAPEKSQGGKADLSSAGPGGGSGKGVKTLIMNLHINNTFKKGDERVKDKHTDDIVDAGRDALVTLGDE